MNIDKLANSTSLRQVILAGVIFASIQALAAEKPAEQAVGLLEMVKHERLTCGGFMEEPGLASDGRSVVWLSCLSRQAADREHVMVSEFRTGRWLLPVSVTPEAGRHESPRIACGSTGSPMVVWIRIEADRWVLEGSAYEDGAFCRPAPVQSGPGKAANPALTAGADGSFWLAWESYQDGRFRIRLSRYIGGSWQAPMDVTDAAASSYDPAVAVDDKSGKLWIAYSAVDNEAERAIFLAGYDVEGGRLGPAIEVALGGRWPHGPNCNSYPSLLCDAEGRVWVAYENDSPNRDAITACFQGSRECSVVCFHDGKLWEVKAQSEKHDGRDILTGRNDHYPLLLADKLGRIWLLARDYHTETNEKPADLQNRRVWHYRASLLDGRNGWTEPEIHLDRRVRLGSLSRATGVWLGQFLFVAWQEDNIFEYYAAPNPNGVSLPCKPVFSNICVARFKASGEARESEEPVLAETNAGVRTDLDGIGSANLRGRRWIPRRTIEASGEKYTLVMGNLHEHTALSLCDKNGADGTLDENYRYARDVHGYDFMAVTDHDHHMYYDAAWRKTIRAADFYDDAPHFLALPAYEFSFLNWKTWGRTWIPALGSQILYFGSHASAARFVKGDGSVYCVYDEESGDLKKLLALLHEKGVKDAVLPPHQLTDYYSVSDWSIKDPEYRTVMEIFQVRGSYEYEGCPRQVQVHLIPGTTEKAAGVDGAWAQDALARGQRMGFIACGDHFATGTGTTVLMVREISRQGIIEALKARRCYATTGDKIFLDFRIDGHLMGREINATRKPRITVAVEGTDALREIVVFKNNKVIYEKNEADLAGAKDYSVDYVDDNFTENSYYYLRVIQANNEIAWASPVWVDVSD